VAYFTSNGGTATTGLHGVATCSLAIAVHNGVTWTSWTPVPTGNPPGTSCTPGGAPPYNNYEFGRWLSMTVNNAGLPVVSYWSVVFTASTELRFNTCTSTACTALTGFGFIQTSSPPSTIRLGRWNSLQSDAAGALYASYYVDNDGAANKGLRFNNNATGAFVATDVEPLSATTDVGRFSRLLALPPTAANGFANSVQVIAYQDTTNASAGFAKMASCSQSSTSACNTPAAWTPGAIPDAGTSNYGRGMSLAVDSNGLPRVAYLDVVNSKVRLLGGQAQAPLQFTSLVDLGANPSPVGLSLAFSNTLLRTFVGFSSATGPQVFAGP
jgi:hypothetical protein